MNIKFDFLIDSEEFSIDMKTGLESLEVFLTRLD